MRKILIVEDDKQLGAALNGLLEEEGFVASTVSTLDEAQCIYSEFDLLILDWRLPDGQGVDLVKDIRLKKSPVPIIMLTAKSELLDKVVGLEAGASDYITKPFEPRELLARVRVQLREFGESRREPVLIFGDLRVDSRERKVSLNDSIISMTKLEYDLLLLLAAEPGRVFSRDEILNKVWGYNNFPTTRTVDTHVLQLRQKLGDQYFETIRGVGYKFAFQN